MDLPGTAIAPGRKRFQSCCDGDVPGRQAQQTPAPPGSPLFDLRGAAVHRGQAGQGVTVTFSPYGTSSSQVFPRVSVIVAPLLESTNTVGWSSNGRCQWP